MTKYTEHTLFVVTSFFLYLSLNNFIAAIKDYEQHVIQSESAKKRRKKSRIKWSTVSFRISDKQFRRMFRMTREAFSELCGIVLDAVGEKEFKSKSYIDRFLKDQHSLYMAHCQ